MNKIYEPHNSSLFDIKANIVVILVWWGATIISIFLKFRFLSFLLPLIFLLFEKKSPLVRQHAGQALSLNILSSLASLVFMILGVITAGMTLAFGAIFIALGALFAVFLAVFGIAAVVCSIIATVKGWHFEEFSIPLIGPFGKILAEKIKLN